jgi:protein-disulfide isomerase
VRASDEASIAAHGRQSKRAFASVATVVKKNTNSKLAKTPASPTALAVAAVLGLLCAAWAGFQWWQLVVARGGGEILCAPGGGGFCAEVWDSPFASGVHASTGLPVAAWGVAWGLVAFIVPLVARQRLARRRAVDAWLAATVVTGFAGALGVAALIGASLRFGHICTTCGVTYVLMLAYAAVCAVALRGNWPSGLARGAGLAASGLAIAFAVLLVPGLNTPKNVVAAGARAVGQVEALPAGTSDDQELAAFIQSLPSDVKQLLSDTLADYAASPVLVPPTPRTVIGPPNARIALVEWSDTLCSHCAQLHDTLMQLRDRLGSDAFTLVPHQYPLDPSCNASVKRPETDPRPCLGARAQICAEGRPGALEFTTELFHRQRELTESLIYELAAPVMSRAELEACVASPVTEQKLQDDIAWAVANDIHGTPMLIVNGRKALPFPPLIYALALTRGSPAHPAFAALPPPKPIPHSH